MLHIRKCSINISSSVCFGGMGLQNKGEVAGVILLLCDVQFLLCDENRCTFTEVIPKLKPGFRFFGPPDINWLLHQW